ncbi:DUF317 domain-containing protein [Streptomyces sp. DSM 42041]|uniref:DUF317 domain-containing protein n=1 Tax=Streptomyces hazeniae TaxID=3075538 RepID=A0ABU2P0D3_9ACTN|nr:DUF317 domain-containing protein [Streptomyces sp. DSM 42041]MDT0382296.1 DUF317 domain-containing protein [Streptomyces sp. DSM 42041]
MQPQEALLYPELPSGPTAPNGAEPTYWVGPRHLAGDDGRLYDTVADTLSGIGWTNLALIRGRKQPDEDQQVLRSTVLHISPDGLRWAQWVLADEPFLLGGLPIAWQVSARTDNSSPIGKWSAYFTPGVPGEALADFLLALDAHDQPTTSWAGPERVLDAATAHGWRRATDRPHTAAADPTATGRLAYSEMPPLIQDADPHTLATEADQTRPAGWQAWSQPTPNGACLWAASFSHGVPHDLVATFAASLTTSTPVLRRVLPDSTKGRLLGAPAD